MYKACIPAHVPNNVYMASVVHGDESEECDKETDTAHTILSFYSKGYLMSCE